ncbi:MAG: aquaporin family protein [Cytophagaceae bacterium]|nr:aquaporin family protein [Gemmatimonadaceae bacterium]
MKKLLTEFIGTFFLVLTIGLTVTQGSQFAPLAIGASLMIMVYMGGHVSGGHYNPAVSLALLMQGAMPRANFGPYVLSQVLGALAASIIVFVVTGKTFGPAPAADATVVSALLVEALYTFALALVVLNSAVAKKTQGNSFYGLAIGFTVVVAAFAGGGISGGAFNPAVGIGPTIINATMGSGSWGALWLYIVGPLVGGALAASVFGIQEEGA